MSPKRLPFKKIESCVLPAVIKLISFILGFLGITRLSFIFLILILYLYNKYRFNRAVFAPVFANLISSLRAKKWK